jgi:hypothetical protein
VEAFNRAVEMVLDLDFVPINNVLKRVQGSTEPVPAHAIVRGRVTSRLLLNKKSKERESIRER